jgi:hypothetical protein
MSSCIINKYLFIQYSKVGEIFRAHSNFPNILYSEAEMFRAPNEFMNYFFFYIEAGIFRAHCKFTKTFLQRNRDNQGPCKFTKYFLYRRSILANYANIQIIFYRAEISSAHENLLIILFVNE